MGKNHIQQYEQAEIQEKLPVRFFRSGDYGSFVPFHYHPALELIYLTRGKLMVEIPEQAASNACMKCALPRFPEPLPASVSDLRGINLRFSDPPPEIEADLPNQCNLSAEGANFVLINCNELHNSACTSYNEAYVLQIPESFLEQELSYDLPLPLRFDLKRASPRCLERLADYLLELTVAHETSQGEMGFKVHFNHALYGILSCLMEIIVPLPALSASMHNQLRTPGALNLHHLAQQAALSQHASELLETEPVNAHPDRTTTMATSFSGMTPRFGSMSSARQDSDLENNVPAHGFRLSDEDGAPYSLHGDGSAADCMCGHEDHDDSLMAGNAASAQLEAEAKVAIALSKNMNLRRLQPVLDFLKTHYNEHIRLDDMAALINLHPRYFCKVFKEAVGMSLLSYVSELRLCHVYNDLTEDKTPISTIMRRHGFSDSKQFYRSFKARFKLTPKEVRNMLRENQEPVSRSYSYFERYSSEYGSMGAAAEGGAAAGV